MPMLKAGETTFGIELWMCTNCRVVVTESPPCPVCALEEKVKELERSLERGYTRPE